MLFRVPTTHGKKEAPMNTIYYIGLDISKETIYVVSPLRSGDK